MATFSERYNHSEARTVVQRDELDGDTRTAIWNLFYRYNEELADHFNYGEAAGALAQSMWTELFKYAIDEYRSVYLTWTIVKNNVLKREWHGVFDLAEFLFASPHMRRFESDLARDLNDVLEANLVGYRIIASKVMPVDSEAESAAISEALDDAASEPLSGVRHHLTTAINKLADRAKPDYPNSVKESISAVEAMLELITKDSVLSKALPKLATSGVMLHPAQLNAWKSLYGWTSDEDGVRHSAKAPPNVDQATAKYMLATCSAFVSWLIEAARKAEIEGLV